MKLAYPLAILPHPKAPLFADPTIAQATAQQVVTALSGGSGTPMSSKDVIEHVAQLGLVNLWFFLKFIAGFNGPYNELNGALHLEMCNWRQSAACMRPGARAAGFVHRGAFKTSCWSSGGNSWEGLRDGNICIGIYGATAEKADEIREISMRTYDSNPIFARCYPWAAVSPGASDWTKEKAVFAHRTRFFREASIMSNGVLSASAGPHHDFELLEDIQGLDDLDNSYRPNANMAAKIKWVQTNQHTLLRSPRTSRVLWVATLYSVGDGSWTVVIEDMRSLVGELDPDYLSMVKSDGTWDVFYRGFFYPETGEPVFPERFTKEGYYKVLELTPWVAMTALANKPRDSGVLEFPNSNLPTFELDWDPREGWLIVPQEGSARDPIRLADCDVVMSVDPAATKKGITAKTSRTSIGIWAAAPDERLFRIWSKVGYMRSPEVFDAIFEGYEAFQGYIRVVAIESNAQQKGWIDLLREERLRRELWPPIKEIPQQTDKTVRIRTAFALRLNRGLIWIAEATGKELQEEVKSFPSLKLDVMDESAIAFETLYPGSADPTTQVERVLRWAQSRQAGAFGWR